MPNDRPDSPSRPTRPSRRGQRNSGAPSGTDRGQRREQGQRREPGEGREQGRGTVSGARRETERAAQSRRSSQPRHQHTSHRPRRQRRPKHDLPSTFKPFTPEQLAARVAAIPVISYPDLPVSARRDEIAQAIRDHQVVIVAGETGSGKTTQLPKICLQLGRGVTGMIGHTQPRRIAARSVADRIAYELDQKVGRESGQVVGYQVRFTDEVGPTTLIKLMTDGILLAEIQSDPLLRRYDTLIIDEAHERSLNIDFILGYLARLLPLRPDLKVIITSATIDSARFAEHFGTWEGARGTGRLIAPAPVVEVSGRTFPVEIRYRPLSADLPTSWSSSTGQEKTGASQPGAESTEQNNPTPSPIRFEQLVLEDPDDDLPTLGYGAGEDIDVETAICHAVDELCAEGDGDILVFLPGERDIRDVEQALLDHLGPRAHRAPKDGTPAKPTLASDIEILPLFARLSAAEQHRVFEPHSLRRVVLATNVAETSLTVPGIRYVIDPGLARISRYSNRTKVQRLPIEPVSQASANQRAGRCGRVADGVAIRLYSQRDYEARPAYTEPEILRTSLASVILQMAALGLGSVADFPFLDAPDSRAVRDGLQLLVEIGALEIDEAPAPSGTVARTTGRAADHPADRATPRPRGASHRLTAIGRDLARLPIDPRLGRMLLEADENGCASEVLVIVAALSIQDVRERPLDHQAGADTAHARFTDAHSDFVTYLNLWRYLNVQSRDLSGAAFRRMCRGEFLHYLRFREWRDVVGQLRQMARPLDLKLEPIGIPSAAAVIEESRTGGIADAAARAAVAYTASSRAVHPDQIHRSLLVGLLSNLGNWDEAKREYQGARGTRFTIWPGSGLARSHPAWVMTAELVETSRLFARTVARINPDWIEPLAGPLLKRTYSEPFWSAAKGAAMVKEKVLLYGLTLSADRPVLLGRLGDVPLGSLSGDVARRGVLRAGSLAAKAAGLHSAGHGSDGRGDRGSSGSDSSAVEAVRRAELLAALTQADPRFDVRISGADHLASATADSSATGAASASEPGAATAAQVAQMGAHKGGPLADPAGTFAGEPAHTPRPVAPVGESADEPEGSGSSVTEEPGVEHAPVPELPATSTITARELAREMLIRHGLVRGEWRERHRFLQRNEELLDQAREVERRSRLHGLVADEDALCAFFDDVLPDHIVSAGHFNAWFKRDRTGNSKRLTYTQALLLPRGTGADDGAFPDHWVCGDMRLPLSYQFAPGSSRDGVTMTIPVEVLPRVSDQGTDWLVPGMLTELVTETIRALPKAKRRLLAPAPEVGERAAQWMRARRDGEPVSAGTEMAENQALTGDSYATSSGSRAQSNSVSDQAEDPMSLAAAMGRLAAWGAKTGTTKTAPTKPSTPEHSKASGQAVASEQTTTPAPAAVVPESPAPNMPPGQPVQQTHVPFAQLFADAIRVIRGVDLSEADLAHAAAHLPPHLRMTFVVVDRRGKELGAGTDLAHLQKTLAQQSDSAVRQAVRTAVSDALEKAARSAGRLPKKGTGQSAPTKASNASTSRDTADSPDKTANNALATQPTSPATTSAITGENTADLHGLHQDGLTTFPETPLPRSVSSSADGMVLRGFPALVPQGTAANPQAGVRVMASPAEADRQHREGLAHLLLARVALATKRVTTRWTGREALMLAATSYGDTTALVAEAQLAAARYLVDELAGEHGPASIRDAAAFEALAGHARDLHEDRVYVLLGHVVRAMEAHGEVQDALRRAAPSLHAVAADVEKATNELIGPGFLLRTPREQMPHLARFVRSGAVRLRRAGESAGALRRDAVDMERVHALEAEAAAAREAAARRPFDPVRAADIDAAYWMIFELRVSLFAQQLGTPTKVSAKRVLGVLERAGGGNR